MDPIILEGSNALKTFDLDLKYPELDILVDFLHIYNYQPKETFAFHAHPNFELHYYESGEGEIAFLDTELPPNEQFTVPAKVKSPSDPNLIQFQLKKSANAIINNQTKVLAVHEGSAFFNPPGQYCWQQSSEKKPLVEYAMRFSFIMKDCDQPVNTHFVKEYKLIHQLLSQDITKVFQDDGEIKSIFENIFKEAYYKKPAFLINIKNELIKLIIAYSRLAWNEQKFSYFIPEVDSVQKRLSMIDSYILVNLSINITIEQLAKNVNMSERSLSRFIKQRKGVSIHQYITQIKINKAVDLLNNELYSISDVAFMTGFSSPFHLSKSIKKYTGKNPSTL